MAAGRWAAFVEYGSGSKTTQVTLRRSADQGTTWPASLTTMVSEPGDALTYAPVDCATDGAGAWVLYQLSDKPDASTNKDGPHTVAIRLAHVAGDGVVDRRTSVTAVDEGGQFVTPRLAVGPGGRVDVVYIAGVAVTDPNGSLRVRSSTDGGKSFDAPRTLQTGIALAPGRGGPTWLGDYMGAARDDGALLVAFANNAGGASHIQFLQSP